MNPLFSRLLEDFIKTQRGVISTYKIMSLQSKVLEKIISYIGDNKDIVKKIYYEKGCGLVHYINYIHKHISLYVMSLTKIDDGMNMWNYYGQGGMELNFFIDNFINSLKETLSSEKEFLAEAHVIYANSDFDIEKMEVPTFSESIIYFTGSMTYLFIC